MKLTKINFARLLAYRVNAINGLVSSIVWSSFVILSMVLLTSRVSHIFAWNRNELLVLAGTYNIIYGIFYLLFSRNFEEFSNNIHLGKLDSILTKPIDSQFAMTFWYISFPNLFRLIFGLAFTFFILFKMNINITILEILSFISLIILSVIILYSFWMIMMTLIIWFTRLSNLIDLLYQINGVMRYPREMYQGASQALLILVFPLTFIVISPAKALLERIVAGDVLYPIIFSLVLFFISRVFWKFALRFYTSASG